MAIGPGLGTTGWIVRLFLDRSGRGTEAGWLKDFQLIFALLVLLHYDILIEIARFPILSVSKELILVAVGLLSSLPYLIVRHFGLFSDIKPIPSQQVLKQVQSDSNHPLKPLLFPCRTTHTRLFPQKHTFSYSYLFVGVPIGWRGSAGSMIAADAMTLLSGYYKKANAWYKVEATDHLDRGSTESGLHGKLQIYLESQKESINEYPYAYLVTAPRFLGYSFNPVSFWYLYSKDLELTAMILEVNNTFDERRMYYLKGCEKISQADSILEEAMVDEARTSQLPKPTTTTQFKDVWAKDFHVSPFNSRKGSYALSACDPFAIQNTSRPVNNIITLSSSKDHPKLVARVFSTGPYIDPTQMSMSSKIWFLASWCWVGFVTFPRIVKEAGKLFFRRKLHVWYRPEVLKDSVGRTETGREKIIEDCYRKFLKSIVEQSSLNLALRYTASGVECQREETFHPASTGLVLEKARPECIQLKILTPLFYSSIVRCAHVNEFLSTEMLHGNDKTRTFWTSNPEKLLRLFTENPEQAPEEYRTEERERDSVNQVRWSMLRRLRHPSKLHGPVPDIRYFPLSPLDQFVRANCGQLQARAYRRSVTALLISDYVTFGVPAVLDAFEFSVRLLLCYLCLETTLDWLQILLPENISSMIALNSHQYLISDGFVRSIDAILRCNALHFWWFVKSLL